MNINIEYTKDGAGALWHTGSIIKPQDILEASQIFFNESNFHSIKYLIFNLLNCSDFNLPTQYIQKIVEMDIDASKLNKNLHFIILTGEPLTYNTTQSWKHMLKSTNWNIEVFKTKREGVFWIENKLNLKIPPEIFEIKFKEEPIHINYNSEKNLLSHKGVGSINFGDFLNFYTRLKNYELKPNYKVIADYSEAYTNLTFEDLLIMAQKRVDTAKNMGVISIALVGKTDLIKNLLKLYKMLLDKDCFKVEQFESRIEAEAWLKV